MNHKKPIRNIGIVAHVDAGKTTLTEQLLYIGGAIRSLGRVDNGTAHTDSLTVERERGISVKAAEGSVLYQETEIHLIDTPGHIDFAGEVERSLRVLDGAIVVISALEGVQPQTEVYFNALKQLKIPTLIFINKIDRVGVNLDQLINDIKKLMTSHIVSTQKVSIDDHGVDLQANLDLIETVSEYDDELLELFINDNPVTLEKVSHTLETLVEKAEVYPIYYGSALKNIGVEALLDGIIKYLPAPIGESSEDLSGVIYKIGRDKTFGKVCFARIYSGTIKNRDEIYNHTKDEYEKVAQIKILPVSNMLIRVKPFVAIMLVSQD